MRPSRSAIRFGSGLALVWLAWVILLLAGPVVVEAAYEQRSLPFINALISGGDQHGLDRYLTLWSSLAGRATIALALLSAAAVALFRFRVRLGRAIAHGVSAISIPVRPRLGAVVFTALTIGLIAGAIEVAYQAITYTARAWPTGDFYWDKVWLTPLSMALSMVLIGLLLYPLTRPWRKDATLGLLPAAIGTVAGFAVARAVGGIHPAAAIVFAVGVVIAISGRAARSPSTATRRFVRTGAALAALLATFAAGLHAKRRVGEWRAVATLTEPQQGAPNVLMIILDTVRARSMSLYGHERETTPNIDAFAAGGVVFANAWAPTAWTLPSHASIFTGRPAAELQTDYVVGLDEAPPTLAEAFAADGYVTAGFVANFYYASRQSGLARGFAHYEDHPINLRSLTMAAWLPRTMGDRFAGRIPYFELPARKRADRINRDFLDWLESRPDRPFFAFLNYLDAHDPYTPPEPFRSRFGGGTGRYGLGFNQQYPPEALRSLENHYDGALAWLDSQVGRLLDQLEAAGTLDNTIVVITSDHGEQFGEHGPRFVLHGRSLYSPGLHVPLIVAGPDRVPAGHRIEEPVALANIAATVLDLAKTVNGPVLPGSSLTRFWEVDGDTRSSSDTIVSVATQNPRQGRLVGLPIDRGPMRSLLVDRWHLIVNGDGEEELYDVLRDPWEQSNLIPSAEGSAKAAEVRGLLDLRTPPRFTAAQGR